MRNLLCMAGSYGIRKRRNDRDDREWDDDDFPTESWGGGGTSDG